MRYFFTLSKLGQLIFQKEVLGASANNEVFSGMDD